MRTTATLLLLTLFAAPAFAHCDSVEGPVVLAAKQALERGDIAPVLKWIPAAAETEVRDAFAQTMKVRGANAAARTLADRWFFETIVRIHRQSEGEPFTGLTSVPAPEGIAAADAAIEARSVTAVESALLGAVRSGLAERFAAVQAAAKHADESAEAGRRYVAAYVEWIHYVERLHEAATTHAATHAEH